ncbi:MAG: glycosyltransferase [Saprospiraceae bacterium]|nr:glycosyltransferase [Candidatus Brachybacter algidus]MBL0119976.1 glycosyltransferase [Candidatus Brachybacter algidus]
MNEPWGVVIHEFAIAGFPIICSDACGASDVFVRDGYNGYTFKKNDKVSLKRVLKKVLNLPNEQLCMMAHRSHILGGYLTPEMWAATAYSY